MIHFHSIIISPNFVCDNLWKTYTLDICFSMHLNEVTAPCDHELLSETDKIKNLDRNFLKEVLTIAACELLFIDRDKLTVLL